MKGFIEVHLAGGKSPTLLNIDQIINVNGNSINTDGWLFEVQESYDEIKQKIEEAQQ
nr:MAG TPA: Flagellar and Swarming motility protein [Caudoviricetes sp.]